MKARWAGFQSVLGPEIQRFVVHKRALRRRYDNEEKTLRLLDAFLATRDLATPEAITPEILEEFLGSRPRRRPRSYNHLLGVVRRLFDWLVAQDRLKQSPLRAKKRRETAQRIPYLFNAITEQPYTFYKQCVTGHLSLILCKCQ